MQKATSLLVLAFDYYCVVMDSLACTISLHCMLLSLYRCLAHDFYHPCITIYEHYAFTNACFSSYYLHLDLLYPVAALAIDRQGRA